MSTNSIKIKPVFSSVRVMMEHLDTRTCFFRFPVLLFSVFSLFSFFLPFLLYLSLCIFNYNFPLFSYLFFQYGSQIFLLSFQIYIWLLWVQIGPWHVSYTPETENALLQADM
uniref:Uncharacterized protein n=1 Tax=Cacopsylla melanoneura TaxID=428564 RepID=A0A8D8S0V7_9HEMI